MCNECEVLKTSLPDVTTKTNEWLKSNFTSTTNCCIHKQSSSSEDSAHSASPVDSDTEAKSAEENDTDLQGKSIGEVEAKMSSEPPRTRRHRRHHHHHHAKSHKRKHSAESALESTQRFKRTATVLRCSGLFQITRSIAQLLRDNEKVQAEIDKLKLETQEHSKELQKQLQKNLEAQRETSGTCSKEGQKLLTKLTQFGWK